MMNPESAQEALRRLMKKYKLTSTMVAKIVGVKGQSVRNWMCGIRPTPEYALKLIRLTYGK
jgi:DNA-binding transcriptional regulator YiaG